MCSSICRWFLRTLAIVLLPLSIAFAQGSTKTTLSGVVIDPSGGEVPGATVEVKNIRTGVVTSALTNSRGAFEVPALDAGMYTVSVALSGFKTAVLNDVELLSGTPRSMKVTLEVGGIEQKIEVKGGGSQLIQTQATSITSTIRVDQIATLPLITRNGLNLVVGLPGVDTGASNHSQRSSTVVGLPQSALSITVDGANVQDKYTRSNDGFFVNIHPKLDLIEEVTVSTATATADVSGQGAVQIRFATRSGTNAFNGSAYWFHRDRDLNSNYYFNKINDQPRNVLTLNQWGFREGGPIMLPGYDGRGKAFFFFNYEQLRFPLSNTRTRGLLTPDAQNGIFRYGTNGATAVNLYEKAAAGGFTSTPDPTILALLTKIRTGTTTEGRINPRTDVNTLEYVWQPESLRIDNSPGGRVDFNLSTKHRLMVSYNYQGQRLTPNLFGGDDPNFPGLINQAHLYSAVSRGSTSLRSTLSSALVNEVRVGISYAPVWFADLVDTTQFEDQQGFSINFPGIGSGITNASTNTGPSSRNGKSYSFDESLSWLRGSHSIQMGGSFSRTSGWTKAQQVVATLTLGVDQTNDPANAMFNTTNFPGASGANLTDARNLYALLTGRITTIGSNARLDGATGQYVYLGTGETAEHQDEYGLFIQDSWRFRPNLTFNAGLRWQVAMPFSADSSVYSRNTMADLCGYSGPGTGPGGRECNLFNPGVTTNGTLPTYQLYTAGTKGYDTDYNNLAPNVGVAWQPGVREGWLRTLLGDPDQATVRASFGVAYNSDGLGFYTGVYNGNPGNQITTSRTSTSATFPLVPAGETWPVLLRQPDRLGASPNIPVSPNYPLPIDFNSGVNLFHPSFRTPFTRSFSVGLQRSIDQRTAIEVRYVGTRLLDGTATENWNEINFTTNGFMDEFRLAMANLKAHVDAGCTGTGATACSFAYRGPGTNTSPLPIYLANLTGRTDAGTAGAYTGTNWTNTNRLGELAQQNPNPGGAASTLYTTAAFRANLVTANYPRNFWVLNPDVNSASVTTNGNSTKYDSIQLNLRRALSNGLSVDANYVYSKRYATALDTLRRDRVMVRSNQSVPHALKIQSVWDIPVGRSRRFLADANPWVDGVIGGWSLNLNARVQSGTVLSFGNVRVVGMTEDELRDAFKIRIDNTTPATIVYTLPQDIIDNTIRAFSVSATSATGYGALGAPTDRYLAPANNATCIQAVRGDCAPRDVFVEGPAFTRFDLQVRKRFAMGGKRSFDLSADFMNLFNAINFNPVAQAGAGANINQVEQAYQDPNVTFDPGGRLIQLGFRFNW